MPHSPPKLIAVGDNCLDVYLTRGFLAVGGNALNVAVQWHNLGFDSRYFGAVGEDPEAAITLAAINAAGLSADDVETRPGASAVTLLADDQGERRFLFESFGVGEDYVPEPSRFAPLRAAHWVHLGTNASAELVRRLLAEKIPFSIDVSTRHFALPLAGVPLVFASGPDDPAEPVDPLFAAFSAAGAEEVVITCGPRGSFHQQGGVRAEAASVPVAVVDTCGAGDSFIASFIAARKIDGLDPSQALELSAARASETCTHLGGFPQPVQPIPQWLLEKYDGLIRSVQEESA